MGNARILITLAAAAFVTAVPLHAAHPQAEKANWDNLKNLAPGELIQVVLNDAKSLRGGFQTVSDETIVVRVATGDPTFARQTILRVSSKRSGHRGRNAL